MKNILAISGSLREGSSNHNILHFLSKMMSPGIRYIIYNGLRDIPAFDPGIDNDNPPAAVTYLREKHRKLTVLSSAHPNMPSAYLVL